MPKITHHVDTYVMEEHVNEDAPSTDGVIHIMTLNKMAVDCTTCILLLSDPDNSYNLQGAEYRRRLAMEGSGMMEQFGAEVDESVKISAVLVADPVQEKRFVIRYPSYIDFRLIVGYCEWMGWVVIEQLKENE